MREHEVFEMLNRIDGKLDDIKDNCQKRMIHCSECMDEDRQELQEAIEKKASWSDVKWITAGIGTILLILLGYTVDFSNKITKIQTELTSHMVESKAFMGEVLPEGEQK